MEGGITSRLMVYIMKSITAKEKKWIIKDDPSSAAAAAIARISDKLNIHPIVAKLLYNRGFTEERAVRAFMSMESEMLCNPFLMKDVDLGIERIHSAIENNETITVYGDYDVDGVTSVCTLYLYLKSKGARINYYIPNRSFEGYGVSNAAIDQINERGTKLIITVDTGITAIDEVEYAKTLGIDTVITDHHECHLELPDAVAVINPHRADCVYPFKELAGVGVVFKVISAYEEKYCNKSRSAAALKIISDYADLVAIGTIADVMPIKEENRIIVSYGLKMIENTLRPGLIALMDASSSKDVSRSDRQKKRSKITSGYIGFTIAPRINAAGRIKSAEIAVELFLSKNEAEAKRIADELCLANKERQSEENKIMKEAFDKIDAMDLENTPVIVLEADNWHHGVIGIVASRITEKYSKPSILISFEGNEGDSPSPDDVGKGSGRSIKGLNLVDALCYCSEHLVKFGGHELAAGLSVTRGELDNFRQAINDYARKNLSDDDMIPTLEADCIIDFKDANLTFVQQLQKLEPYGPGNLMPAFVMRDIWVNEISSVSDGKHTRLILSNGQTTITAMYFSNSPESLGIFNGDKIDVLFNLDINEWLGKRSVQLIVKDVKLTHSGAENGITAKERFEEIWNGATISREEDVLPSRDDFVTVYKYIVSACRAGNCVFSHRELCIKLSQGFDNANIGYIKLKIIIMVLRELNLIGIEETSDEVYKFSFKYSQKTNLEKSSILKRLKNQQKK